MSPLTGQSPKGDDTKCRGRTALFEFRSLRVGHLIHIEAPLCFDLKAVYPVGWIAMLMDTFRTGKMLVCRDVVAQAG